MHTHTDLPVRHVISIRCVSYRVSVHSHSTIDTARIYTHIHSVHHPNGARSLTNQDDDACEST
jgi:hypothetical protein